jgi:hypothetical protein
MVTSLYNVIKCCVDVRSLLKLQEVQWVSVSCLVQPLPAFLHIFHEISVMQLATISGAYSREPMQLKPYWGTQQSEAGESWQWKSGCYTLAESIQVTYWLETNITYDGYHQLYYCRFIGISFRVPNIAVQCLFRKLCWIILSSIVLTDQRVTSSVSS